MTGVLIVRRTGPPMAVRRGTLMVPDCAVITCLGAFSPQGKTVRPDKRSGAYCRPPFAPRTCAPPSARPVHRSRKPAMGLNCDVAMQSSVAVGGSILSPPRILPQLRTP
jgi:hypothetical protein